MTHDNRINIVVVCDDSYAQHATVMLRSLLSTNAKLCFSIFCLVPEKFGHRQGMEESLQDFENHDLFFILVSSLDFASLKVSGHISRAAYFRLRLDKLLPADLTRAIYLDCDIIIKSEILSLWTLDLEGHALAAAIDTVHNANHGLRHLVGLDQGTSYLNSGVMLIDLKQWREVNIGDRALEFCLAHPERITYWDQCAINHVINGKFKILERRWNFHTSMTSKEGVWTHNPDSLEQLNNAAIIHFAGEFKPWHYRCLHPLRDLYWAYLKQTTWRDYTSPDRTAINVIRNALIRHAPIVSATYRRLKRLVALMSERLTGK
jgi:lipopolysaccharide biosynthesis glycosyltransferase